MLSIEVKVVDSLKTRVILLAAFAVVVAACGGTAEVTDTQPRTTIPITTTLTPTSTTAAPAPSVAPTTTAGDAGGVVLGAPSPQLKAVRSAIEQISVEPPARVDGLIEIAGTDAELGDLEISMPISSSFDSVTGDGHMSIDFSGMLDALGDEVPAELSGTFDKIEIRQVGDTAYMSFGLLTAMFGVETEWLSMPVEDGEGFTQDFSSGVNPYDATGYLESLKSSGGDVTVVGTETLRGVETTHYRAVFDLESLAEIDPDAFAELQDSAPVGVGEFPMELWIDDLNRVHRFFFELDAPELGDLNPGESFDYMRVQFDFSDYGGRVTVDPPPASDVTDISELEELFGSMFGDLEDFDI